nr:VCBS repeat-containing protein [Fodinibius salsisoli]
MYTFRNFYNGGGVGAGDINGDGLPDLFFTGNMVPNRLYLNKGNFKFEDISETAGIKSEGVWTTGVSFVDINSDDLLDIYVTKSGPPSGDNRHNELFINNGDLTFTEKAEEYGLAEVGLSTHAVFFDYDRDGDLDMYLLNNSFDVLGDYENITGKARHVPDPDGGSKLFSNRNGHFEDVSEEAGIFSSAIGFGLSASISDLNRDGWPDIYVANDFFERDYLYINNQDSTFDEVLPEQMQSISASSMGTDIADLTGDGWPEIFVADMLPFTERRKKSKMTFQTFDEYKEGEERGFHRQVTRNTLQLSNRDGTFSEVSRMADVDATDWSWATLLADFDHNGHNDIYVTNGIFKDLLDQDYLEYASNPRRIKNLIESSPGQAIMKLLEEIPSEPIENKVFAGLGELSFEDKSDAWGVDTPGFSSGAAWADLDNDGALDLIVNEVNGPVLVYRNRVREEYPNRNFLTVKLIGDKPNTQGIGTQLDIWSGEQHWYREQMLQRGFQSSVAPELHAGLDTATHIDSLQLQWPDGRVSFRKNVDASVQLVFKQSEATVVETKSADVSKLHLSEGSTGKKVPWLAPLSKPLSPGWSHRENSYNDFEREQLLAHMRSTEGPALCSGDVNGDKNEDFYIGGAKGQAGRLFLHTEDGKFTSVGLSTFEEDAGSEDTDCAFFDANGDGFLDLYVTSGGNSFSAGSSALLDRLYLGNGQGGFQQAEQLLPSKQNYVSSSTVAVNDVNSDGHPDLFVGERLKLFAVGLPAKGFMLINDGSGNLREQNKQWAPSFDELGMITDAVWTDWDQDGRNDLVVVGEFMSPRIFRNTSSGLKEITEGTGISGLKGWWNAVHANDLNGDGRPDLVVGNHGLNSQFKADTKSPVRLRVGDFEKNGQINQLLSISENGSEYPFVLRNELVTSVPSMKSKYPDYKSFAGQNIEDILTEEQRASAHKEEATELASVVLWNRSEGAEVEQLPLDAQLSPIYGIWSEDISGDSFPELLLGGNLGAVKPLAGPYLSSYGVVLSYRDNEFMKIDSYLSGLKIKGEIRNIEPIKSRSGNGYIVIARNNDSPVILQVQHTVSNEN